MPTRLKWKTDLEKSVVILNFERRGWLRVNSNSNINGNMNSNTQVTDGGAIVSQDKDVINADNSNSNNFNSATNNNNWNFYWASVGTVKQIFNPESGSSSLTKLISVINIM